MDALFGECITNRELTFQPFLDRFVYDSKGSLLVVDLYLLSIASCRKDIEITQSLQQEDETIVG